MHRFYLNLPLIDRSQSIDLPKNICGHVYALRIKQGDVVQLFNGDGYNYQATLSFKSRNHIIATIKDRTLANNESPLKITLIQSFSTGQKMDFIVQKAVELGVNKIYPAISSRTNAKLSINHHDNKHRRWYEIIHAACEQSGRATIPTLHPIADLNNLLQNIKADCKLLLHPSSTNTPPLAPQPLSGTRSFAIAIGPEGGFSEQEVELAKINNFRHYSLGPRILRTETAPIAAIASLQAKYGDFS